VQRIINEPEIFHNEHCFHLIPYENDILLNILARRNHNSGKLETGIPDAGNQLNSA